VHPEVAQTSIDSAILSIPQAFATEKIAIFSRPGDLQK
jgi:hypothetical protein